MARDVLLLQLKKRYGELCYDLLIQFLLNNDSILGGLTMSFFTLVMSCIGIVMFLVYLSSDKDQIIKELSDQNPAMKDSLNDHSTCKYLIKVINENNFEIFNGFVFSF